MSHGRSRAGGSGRDPGCWWRDLARPIRGSRQRQRSTPQGTEGRRDLHPRADRYRTQRAGEVRCEAARFALVLWRDTHMIGCIPLDVLPEAVAADAVIVIAKEWDIADAGISLHKKETAREDADL